MKKLIIFVCFLSLNFIPKSFAQLNDSNIKTLIQAVQTLLKQHSDNLHSLFKKSSNVWETAFERDFFANNQFLKHNIAQNFFQQIEYNMTHNKDFNDGIQYVSYDEFVSVNGVYQAVHYEYTCDGKHATFHRHTDNNGHVLKASYTYNIGAKMLEVSEFKDSQKKNQQSYTLKV